MTLTPDEVRRQNEVNARSIELAHRVDSLEDENDDLRRAEAARAAEAAAERAAREKADAGKALTEQQLDDCGKALVAERRRGFWNKIAATLKAAPLAFAAGAAVSAVVVLAATGGN